MKKTIRIFWLALAILFAQGVFADVSVRKSPNDDRQYQYLQLDNGLKVLLISDPKADKAAAALAVGVGSLSNPPDRQGLAHFLEHMLFMGTKKYPDVDEYSDYIKKHGGMDNAWTAGSRTVYFFDIQPEALEGALDRFAQFFIAPLMDARYVERERHAVESEYQLKRKDDARRIGAAQKQGYNPGSPWSRFSVGSLETLADRPGHPVRDDLLKFYQRHYSANIMSLVVLGREPLPVLRRWVEARFAKVPDRKARREKPAADELIYLPSQLPEQVSVVPLKKLHQLELAFPLPPQKPHYRVKPAYYLSHFLGYEGPGSLHARLKQEGWITSLTTSVENLDESESMFFVTLDLTPDGVGHVDEILGAFFAHVELLREKGIEPWRYAELQRKAELDFRFREKNEPSDYVSTLASRLLDYPPAEVLTAGTLLEQYDPKLIRATLDRIRPERMALTLVDPGVETDKVERWYQVPYSVHELASPAGRRDPELVAGLALPKPNPFLPEKVALKPIARPGKRPRLLVESAGLDLWHQQDDAFGVPRGALVASLESPVANDRPEHAVELQLLVELVKDQLDPFIYPATQAGLGYSLDATSRGLTLVVHGYDDKQPEFLEKILAALSSPKFDADRFRVLKRKLARNLANKALDRPFVQVIGALNRTLVKPSWSPEEKLAALEKVKLAELERYAEGLFDQAELKMLTYGNLTATESRKMEALLRERLLVGAALREIPDPQVVRLEVSRQPRRVDWPVDHPDSVVASYYQGMSRGVEEQAYWRLLAQTQKNAFFSSLRTEQQLGYVVVATAYETERLPGLLFLVQSSAVSAKELERRIDAFVRGMGEALESMSEEAFAAYKAGLVSSLLKKDQNTLERALRYMENIERGEEAFDFRRKVAARVEQLTRKQLLDFYRQRLLERPRRLVVHSDGTRFPPQGKG